MHELIVGHLSIQEEGFSRTAAEASTACFQLEVLGRCHGRPPPEVQAQTLVLRIPLWPPRGQLWRPAHLTRGRVAAAALAEDGSRPTRRPHRKEHVHAEGLAGTHWFQ